MIEQLIIIGFLFLANSLFVIGFYAAFSHGNILYPVYEAYCRMTRKVIELLGNKDQMEIINSDPIYNYDFWIQQTKEDIEGFVESEKYEWIVFSTFYPMGSISVCDGFNSKELSDEAIRVLKPFQRLESIRAYLSKPLFLCSYCMPSLYAPLFFLLLNLTFPNALPFELSLSFFIIWIPCLSGFNYLLGYSIPLKSE